MPTTTDFDTLQAGATGGLFNWGPANHLDMFTPQAVNDQYGGGTGIGTPPSPPSWSTPSPRSTSAGTGSAPAPTRP